MSKNDLSRKAWQRATNVLLWYSDNLREYASLQAAAYNYGSQDSAGKPYPDPTAATAIRLVDGQRIRTLRDEIEAVEEAVAMLSPEHKEVIRRRFFEGQRGSQRKPRQYVFLQDVGYSERQMKRICRTVIRRVAASLGEK